MCGVDAGDYFIKDLQGLFLEFLFIVCCVAAPVSTGGYRSAECVQIVCKIGKCAVVRRRYRIGVTAFTFSSGPVSYLVQGLQQVVLDQCKGGNQQAGTTDKQDDTHDGAVQRCD